MGAADSEGNRAWGLLAFVLFRNWGYWVRAMSPYLVIFQGCLETCSFRTKACLACVHPHTEGFKSGTGVTSAQHPPPRCFCGSCCMHASSLKWMKISTPSLAVPGKPTATRGQERGSGRRKERVRGAGDEGNQPSFFLCPRLVCCRGVVGVFVWGIFFFPF